MIAPNGNGPLQGNGPSVMAADAGQGAVNHSEQDSLPAVTWEVVMLHSADDFTRHVLPMGAVPYEVTDAVLASIRENDAHPLVCPCHDDPYGNGPCVECRAEIDAMLVRRGLKAPEPDYEPRDGGDDLC